MDSASLDRFKTSHRKPQRTVSFSSLLVFGALGLLMVAGLVGALISEEPISPEVGLRYGGAIVFCLWMALPWPRIRSIRDWVHLPKNDLGYLSKLAVWTGAGFLPLTLVTGQWAWALLSVVAVIATSHLWTQRSWAIWPWYAIAVASVVAYAAGIRTGHGIAVFLYTAVGIYLLREIRDWRRRPVEAHQE